MKNLVVGTAFFILAQYCLFRVNSWLGWAFLFGAWGLFFSIKYVIENEKQPW